MEFIELASFTEEVQAIGAEESYRKLQLELLTNPEKGDLIQRSLAVRPMRNKWGSCSTAGSLNFDAQLLTLDEEIGTYVIVHELLHFFVPNHGRLWKSLMRAHLGDYERVEERLRKIEINV